MQTQDKPNTLCFFSFRLYPPVGIAAVLQQKSQTVQHSFPMKKLTEVLPSEENISHL